MHFAVVADFLLDRLLELRLPVAPHGIYQTIRLLSYSMRIAHLWICENWWIGANVRMTSRTNFGSP